MEIFRLSHYMTIIIHLMQIIYKMKIQDIYLINTDMSKHEATEYAMKRVDFHFYKEFTEEDFIVERQHRTFMYRVNQIGVKVISKTESMVMRDVFMDK